MDDDGVDELWDVELLVTGYKTGLLIASDGELHVVSLARSRTWSDAPDWALQIEPFPLDIAQLDAAAEWARRHADLAWDMRGMRIEGVTEFELSADPDEVSLTLQFAPDGESLDVGARLLTSDECVCLVRCGVGEWPDRVDHQAILHIAITSLDTFAAGVAVLPRD